MHSKLKETVLYLLPLLMFVPMFLPAGVSFAGAEQPIPEEISTLRMVLIPEKNVFEQRRRYKYITDYLSRQMNINFIVEILSSYGNISEAFIEGKADAGFFGSFSYVLTNAKAGIEPLVRPVWPDNSSTYRGYIFVRADSGIKSVKDMKDKRLVLVDKATTAGYIFQRFYFKYSGIDNIEEYFSKITFAKSHDAAAWAVFRGEADIGGAKNHIFNSLRNEYPEFNKQMIILAESPEVPSNGLAVKKDLNPVIKLRIKMLLLSLHETPKGQEVLKKFGALKFIETNNEDYEVLNRMIDKLDIDLHSYSYE